MFVRTLVFFAVLLVTPWVQAQETCTPQVTTLTGFTLRWTPPIPAPGLQGALQEYVLERQSGAAGPWTAVATVPATTLLYRDSPLSVGQTYTYRLTARWRTPANVVLPFPFATHGTPPPCVTVTTVGTPGSLTGIPD